MGVDSAGQIGADAVWALFEATPRLSCMDVPCGILKHCKNRDVGRCADM